MRQPRCLKRPSMPQFTITRKGRSYVGKPEYDVIFPKCNNLKELLKKATGQNYVLKSKLKSLISLDGNGESITSLDGIQYCTRLKEINLRNNLISDLSPLLSLPKELELLALGENQIKDISPLRHFKSIKTLDITNNLIKDLKPLFGVDIEYLWGSKNLFQDVTDYCNQEKSAKENDFIKYLPIYSSEIVKAKKDIHPRIATQFVKEGTRYVEKPLDNIKVYDNIVVPQGTLGVIISEIPDYISVWFSNLYKDVWYFPKKDLEKASLFLEEAMGILENYQGHHCRENQFQYNVKMYNTSIPDEIQDSLSWEETSQYTNWEIENYFEEFQEEILQVFSWIKKIYTAGRSGGWLVLDSTNRANGLLDDLSYYQEQVEDFLESHMEEIPGYIKDMRYQSTEIVDIALSLNFIQEVIKNRLSSLQETLSSKDYWEEVLDI